MLRRIFLFQETIAVDLVRSLLRRDSSRRIWGSLPDLTCQRVHNPTLFKGRKRGARATRLQDEALAQGLYRVAVPQKALRDLYRYTLLIEIFESTSARNHRGISAMNKP